jgi:hypothetical protein
MLSVFWGSQRVLFAHFQKRGENVNSASYCEVLLKLWNAIRRKQDNDNARPHTARATQQRIQELSGNFLNIRLTADFHLFGPLNNHLGGKGFADKK